MTTSNDLSCQELVELITSYLEMTLPLEVTRRFEAHLTGCDGCARYLDQMRRTVTLVSALREVGIPIEAKGRLLAAFRDWKQGT